MRHVAVMLLLTALVPFSAGAVGTTQPPQQTVPTPGQVQSTLPVHPAPKLPQNQTPITVPPVQPSQIPAGGPVFRVSRFELTGNTVFAASVLQAELASYLNRDLTLADLYKAAAQLTRYYQQHGYGVARVTVPAQKIVSGSVKLEVIEGHIAAIKIEGNTRTRTNVLRDRMASLKPGQIYTDVAMERAILLINDLPGLQARALLEPGQAYGTLDVNIKAVESAMTGYVSVDDYGRSSIGRWRLNTGVTLNSPSGSGDRLSASLTHAAGNLLNFGALSYSLPLPPAGGTLTAAYNRSEYRVSGSNFTVLGISGYGNNATMNYLYPAVRSQWDNLFWGMGLTHSASGTLSKGQEVAGTNLNVMNWNFYYNHLFAAGGYYTLGGQFYSNGQHYDAQHLNAERARMNLDASYVTPFAGDWRFIGQISGQWSLQPLPDTEKFSLGGPDNVRGYLSGEARGDSGIQLSLEIQHPLGVPGWPVMFGGYIDNGKVWEKTALAGPSMAATLTSAGIELLYSSTSPDRAGWNARFQWGYAIGGYRPSDGNQGGHIWLTVGKNF